MSSTDDDANAEFPENHLIAQALVPKFAAALSLFGSSMILTELYLETKGESNSSSGSSNSSSRRRRDGATARILVSLVCCYI
jgi:hypothetical protein